MIANTNIRRPDGELWLENVKVHIDVTKSPIPGTTAFTIPEIRGRFADPSKVPVEPNDKFLLELSEGDASSLGISTQEPMIAFSDYFVGAKPDK